MNRGVTLAIAGLLALAGCGNADGEKSPQDVVREAGKSEKPLPGLYETAVNVLAYDIPGASPQDADRMRHMMTGLQSQVSRFCLKASDVDKGFEEMIRRAAEGNCTFRKFDAQANSVSAQMTCDLGKQAEASINLEGQTGAERSRMVMEIDQFAPDVPGGKVFTRMEVVNRRVGDCPQG